MCSIGSIWCWYSLCESGIVEFLKKGMKTRGDWRWGVSGLSGSMKTMLVEGVPFE